MYNRIAFLKLCCPGDLLFTTPAVRAVKKRFPDARLIYIAGTYSSFVAEHNPNIDETVIFNPPFEISGRLKGARAAWNGARVISSLGLDLVISFHRSRGVATMARLGGARNVLSFETAKPPADLSIRFDPHKHEILRYLDLVGVLGAPPDGFTMEYEVNESEAAEALGILKGHGISGQFAAIAPGGGENPGAIMHIKRWPAYRFKEVAAHLRKAHQLPVVAVGSMSERKLADEISPDVNLAGETSFHILPAILQRASILIGNDSGPLYLASAVGVRTVGIYGPSSPKLVGPLSDRHRPLIREIWCHPCYHPQGTTRGNIECPSGTWACMLTLQAKDIITAVDELLAGAKTAIES
jgi:heptosyltransferase-2